MKRFAFVFVMAAMMTGSFAHAQTDGAVAACGRLTQEMNLALDQRVALETQREQISQSSTTRLGDLRMINAELDQIDAMISEINQEMNKVCQ